MNLKKIVVVVACIFCIGFVFDSAAFAHDMIPPEVIEFLIENPDATDEEIMGFIEANFGGQAGHSDVQEKTTSLLSVAESDVGFFTNAWNFTIIGIEHILIGLDHVLFVISLILVLMPWKKILGMVTTFTIAHSLTLILAGTGLLTLSSRIVEPIIALSIAYTALTTVFLRHIPFFGNFYNKLLIIFVFGIFHGLGFAGVFEEISVPADKFLSSLLFFNVGVEFGQILILCVIIPVLYYLIQYEKVYNYAIKSTAVIISGMSIYWVVERIAG